MVAKGLATAESHSERERKREHSALDGLRKASYGWVRG